MKMGVLELLLMNLSVPLAKFLLKAYLGEEAAALGGGLIDIAKGKIKDIAEQREAERHFQRIGDQIGKKLVPLFEKGTRDNINIEAVTHEIARTLEGRVSAKFFLSKNLDPVKLTKELRRVRPLPKGMFSAAETALYNRALGETVRYLVTIADQLPTFEPMFAAESLGRLSHIGADVESMLQTVQRIERQVVATGREDEAGRYEADYRHAIIRNLDYVELFGADIAPESKRQSLSIAYVSLNLETQARTGRPSESLPVETVLESLGTGQGRLLIRGEAGSGKTTLFRWTAIQAAYGLVPSVADADPLDFITRDDDFALNWKTFEFPVSELPGRFWKGSVELDEKLPWRHRIPFLILLRDCAGGRLPSPDNFPVVVAKELGNPPAKWVTSILREGRALVLFDGVDEISNLDRDTAWSEIDAIVKTYPENYFLVSTRPAAVPEGWLAGLGFREARVNPMSEQDKFRFIDKWHDAVARELARQGKPADLTGLASELKAKLPDNPAISRLATNPLLCAMICALHRDRYQKLPESQAELCDALCFMLLHRRERESGLDLSKFPEAYRTLSYDQKRAIVQEIAHYMVRNEESTVSVEQAKKIVAFTLENFPGRDPSDAGVVLEGLIERSGVLREERPGSTDFVHNTIKEYLAADRFVEEGDIGLLAGQAMNPSWQPVILFAAATRKRDFASQLVRKILETQDA